MNPETQARTENLSARPARPATDILAGVRLEWLNHWNFQDALRDTKTAFEKGGRNEGMLCFASLNELHHRSNPGKEGLGEEIELLAVGLKNGVKDLGELAAAGGGSVLGAVSAAVFPENINLQQMLLETMRWTGKIELGNEAAEDREIEQKLVIVVGNDQIRATSTLLEKALGRMEIEIGQGNLLSAEELERARAKQREAGIEKILGEQQLEVQQRTQALRQLAALKIIQQSLLTQERSRSLQRQIDKLEEKGAFLIKQRESYLQPKLLQLTNQPVSSLTKFPDVYEDDYENELPFWQAAVETISNPDQTVKTTRDVLIKTRSISRREARLITDRQSLANYLNIERIYGSKIFDRTLFLFFRDVFLADFSSDNILTSAINKVINEESVAERMVPESTRSAFEVWRESHPLPDIKAESREPDLEEIDLEEKPVEPAAEEEEPFHLISEEELRQKGDDHGERQPVSDLLPEDMPPVPEEKSETPDWFRKLQAAAVAPAVEEPEAAAAPPFSEEPDEEAQVPAEKKPEPPLGKVKSPDLQALIEDQEIAQSTLNLIKDLSSTTDLPETREKDSERVHEANATISRVKQVFNEEFGVLSERGLFRRAFGSIGGDEKLDVFNHQLVELGIKGCKAGRLDDETKRLLDDLYWEVNGILLQNHARPLMNIKEFLSAFNKLTGRSVVPEEPEETEESKEKPASTEAEKSKKIALTDFRL